MKNKNRYKKLREDYKENHNQELTQEKLAEIFKSKGYDTLNHTAIRKIETDKRNLSTYELKGYCEVFNTTSDYLLGIDDVQRKSPDMSMISRVTGLSDKSIEVLKKFNRKSWLRRYIEPLNYILESEQYTEFANLLYMYFNDSFYVPLRFDPDTGDFVSNVTPGIYSDNSYANVIPIGSPIENNSGYEVSFVETTSFMNAYLLQEMQNILKVIKEKER